MTVRSEAPLTLAEDAPRTLTMTDQLGFWGNLGISLLGFGAAIAVSALIRGSYHLYQGFGGFISNLVFGLLLGWLYQRTRRLWPLVIATR